MRNQFFRTFKDLTQVLGVATVSVGMVLNGLANINEKQNKRRSLHSKEKMNSSPNGIGGVELKKEDVVYAKPNEDAGNVAEFKK